jgi:hypothetical protein
MIVLIFEKVLVFIGIIIGVTMFVVGCWNICRNGATKK